jgi:hypothetical protein
LFALEGLAFWDTPCPSNITVSPYLSESAGSSLAGETPSSTTQQHLNFTTQESIQQPAQTFKPSRHQPLNDPPDISDDVPEAQLLKTVQAVEKRAIPLPE